MNNCTMTGGSSLIPQHHYYDESFSYVLAFLGTQIVIRASPEKDRREERGKGCYLVNKQPIL